MLVVVVVVLVLLPLWGRWLLRPALGVVEDIGRRIVIHRGHGNVPGRSNSKQRVDILGAVLRKQPLDQRVEGSVPQTECFDAAIDPLFAGKLGFARNTTDFAIRTRCVRIVPDAPCSSKFTSVAAYQCSFSRCCSDSVVWFSTAIGGHSCCAWRTEFRMCRSDGNWPPQLRSGVWRLLRPSKSRAREGWLDRSGPSALFGRFGAAISSWCIGVYSAELERRGEERRGAPTPAASERISTATKDRIQNTSGMIQLPSD